jgi:hypothetical protein
MKKYLLGCSVLLTVLYSCKNKKEEKPLGDAKPFFPVLSFIKSQVAHVDTSLYSIRKIIPVDSLRSDTIYYPREEFRMLAAEFLALPDLSEGEYRDRFKETKQYDETLNRLIISYDPIDAEEEMIQRQEVLIRPDPSGDKVSSIYIEYLSSNKDSSVSKKLLWQPDLSFQVTTTRQLPAQPENVSTYRVIWSEDDEP